MSGIALSLIKRTRIGWLFAAALLPGLVAGFVLFLDFYHRSQAQLEQGAQQTARALSLAVDRELASLSGKLEILATSSDLQKGNLAAFYGRAKQVLATEDLAEAIVLIDGSGQQLINTLKPYGATLPKAGHTGLLDKALTSGKRAYSDLYIGGVSNRPFVTIEIPVRTDGQAVYGLGMGISAERMNRLLLEQEMPDGWLATLLDGKGTVIARSLNGNKAVGKKATSDLMEKLLAADEAAFPSHTLEGVPSFVAFSRSKTTGWTVAVAMSRNVLYEGMYRPMGFAAVAVAASLLGGIFLSALFARNVRKALIAVESAALSVQSGDDGAMIPPLAAPREIVRLADRFNRMLEARRRSAEELARHQLHLEELVQARTAELKHAKEAAEAAHAAQSTFLAYMSHELRTPLNAILGFSDALISGIFGPLSERHAAYVNDIHTSGKLLLSLVNDLLDTAALRADRLSISEEEVALNVLVSEALALIAPQAGRQGIRLENEAGRPYVVLVDRRRLLQVLINILGNAVKYNRPNGWVKVVSDVVKSGDIVIEISDSGLGMTQEAIKEAMIPFGRANDPAVRGVEGAGLGLPLSQGLMRVHGGSLAVESSKGVGTIIRLTLPKERVVKCASDPG